MKNSIAWLCFFPVLLWNPVCSLAQPDTVWTRHYGGSGEEICRALIETSDGGYALLGQTTTYGAGSRDFWLVRTDPLGQELWTQSYGGSGLEIGYALCETDDGGFILAGQTNSLPGGNNAWIVRTTAGGDTLWTRKLGGSQRDECYAIAKTPDSGFVCAGYTASYGVAGDFWLVKLNAAGDSLWSRTYGGSGQDICWTLTQTPDGGFLLGGQTQSFGEAHNTAPNFWVVRVNSSGDTLWTRAFGGSGIDVCTSVALMPDSGFIIGGYTQSFGAGREDAWLVRLNTNGDSLWGRTYGTGRSDFCTHVLSGRNGDCFLTGWTTGVSSADDYWLLNADTSGAIRWQRTIGGLSPDQCHAAISQGDSFFLMAGGSYSFTSGGQDFWLVKTRAERPTIYVGPDPLLFGDVHVGSDRVDSVLISNVGDVSFTVLGVSVPYGFQASFSGEYPLAPYQSAWMTVAFLPDSEREYSGMLYVQSTAEAGDSCVTLLGRGIGLSTDERATVPREYALQVYPNPFNSRAAISYAIPRVEYASVILYDLTGRRVRSLVAGIAAAGLHRIRLDGTDIPTGVYFVSLRTPSYQTSQKLVLLK
ncbi:T9SS type A sorting domain-containing protein [bacterium]|nr:T9SS type A sorting domain-containing protein [bacterium]MBU1984120.1 T9SS type A sorting domain-containing protein [bacterium]